MVQEKDVLRKAIRPFPVWHMVLMTGSRNKGKTKENSLYHFSSVIFRVYCLEGNKEEGNVLQKQNFR